MHRRRSTILPRRNRRLRCGSPKTWGASSSKNHVKFRCRRRWSFLRWLAVKLSSPALISGDLCVIGELPRQTLCANYDVLGRCINENAIKKAPSAPKVDAQDDNEWLRNGGVVYLHHVWTGGCRGYPSTFEAMVSNLQLR